MMKKIWVTGYHAVEAVLKLNPERAFELHLVMTTGNPRQQQIVELAHQFGVAFHPSEKSTLSRLCGSEQHQNIALLARAKPELGEKALHELTVRLMAQGSSPLILILDQVQDPHNLGACLRTADAAGVDAVVLPKDNASPITPVVQKVASGAAESLSIFRVTNLARSIDDLKQQGIWVIGTSDKAGQTLYERNLTAATAIVMGAEGEGLRNLTEKKCDSLVRLPMFGTVVSSLNVSVATGVCLYEAVRQRQ